MGTSVFLARLLGPYCVIVAVGFLFNRERYQALMEDFLKSTALIYLGGVIALLFGLIIVLFHNVWVANWAVIITIFGWGGLIKGIWLIVFPNTLAKFMQAYQKNSGLLVVQLAIVLVLGAVLTIFGYFVG